MVLIPIHATDHVATEIVGWVSEDGPRALRAEIDIRGVGSFAGVFYEYAVVLVSHEAPACTQNSRLEGDTHRCSAHFMC